MPQVGDPVVGYSGAVAAKLAGISYRNLDYWARLGVVTPSLGDANGSGTLRRYTDADVDCLRAVQRLRVVGVRLDVCRTVVTAIRAGHAGALELDPAIVVDVAALAAPPPEAALESAGDHHSA